MVYIYAKKIGKETYYYLRASYREGSKVLTKDIAYLGSDLSKIKLDRLNLEKKYKKEIKKAYTNLKKYITSNYYLEKIKKKKLKKSIFWNKNELEEIEAIKLHFNDHFLKLDDLSQKEVYDNFLIDFAFNTTSMEGNTIDLDQADDLLREDIAPSGKTLREIYDLKNTQKVFNFLLEEKPEINHELIVKIHDQLLENIDKRKGYRTRDIRVFKASFKASPGFYVKTDMGLLLKWYRKNKDKIHPLALVILFHHKFEKIHPFFDGNGRTGRMLMNHILILKGYPPVIIRKKNRKEYLESLNLANKCGLGEVDVLKYKKLLELVFVEFKKSYWDNFNI